MLLPLLLNNLLTAQTAYAITAEQGIYAVNGQVASTTAQYYISVDVKEYTLFEVKPTIKKASIITGSSNSFLISGNDADLRFFAPIVLTANSISYSLSGQSNQFQLAKKVQADIGTYSINDLSCELVKKLILTAGSDSYALTGLDASVLAFKGFSAETGTITVNTIAADFVWIHVLTCDLGTYLLSGQELALLKNVPSSQYKSFIGTLNQSSYLNNSINKTSNADVTISANSYAQNINLLSYNTNEIEA
jgi:hypothetical protein